jgi:hypothetical protein
MSLQLSPVKPKAWAGLPVPEQSKARHAATNNTARARKREEHDVTFTGIDGEGISVYVCNSQGEIWSEHRYVLLGIGNKSYENPVGLSFTEVCTALYAEFERNPKTAYVGFYLGYDFVQWLKFLPENRARTLLCDSDKEKRRRRNSGGNPVPFPVRYGDWEFDILGMKRFKLRPYMCDKPFCTKECAHEVKPWMYVCDAGPFFQSSLLTAIDPKNWINPIVTDDEYGIIVDGKSRRATAYLGEDMRRYNALENQALARMMRELNAGFVSAGIRLTKDKWFGPGQAAQAWMRLQKDIPTRTEIEKRVPWQALDDARRTYWGGWFEIFMHGPIPGTSYEYDINSAYPHIIRGLPCLLHGTWEYRDRDGKSQVIKAGRIPVPGGPVVRKLRERRDEPAATADTLPDLQHGQVRFVCATVTGSNKYIGSMLHRFIDGSIARPACTRGWFWQHELEAAQRAGIVDTIESEEWWTYTPCKCRPPVRALEGLYDMRLRVGKNTAQGKSSKLVYNSDYGKFAQTIGEPVYGNLIYASLITAGCRTMILDAIATHPEGTKAVAMVATDGVYFTSPHPSLPISSRLGEWDTAQKINLTLFKPGVYWDDKARRAIRDGNRPQFKARGVNAESFAKAIDEIDRLFAAWSGKYPDTDSDWPKVTFALGFNMVSCLQALHRGKWNTAGMVTDTSEVTHDSNPKGKRDSGYYDADMSVYRSRPFNGRDKAGNIETSLAYNKGLVIKDPETLDVMMPDGYGNLIIKETLGMG